MKVICEVDYEDWFIGSLDKVPVKFEKGKVYEMLTEYNNCYLYYINHEAFLIKKIYFLSIEEVFKKGLLSISRKNNEKKL